MRFMPGETLYQIPICRRCGCSRKCSNRTSLRCEPGQAATKVNAYPGKVFKGRVTYLYPTSRPRRGRASPHRARQPGRQLLKPAMYAQVELQAGRTAPVLSVPRFGRDRQRHAPDRAGASCRRPLRAARSQARRAHATTTSKCSKASRKAKQVVVAANFLIDAESNLKAAIGGLGRLRNRRAAHRLSRKSGAPAASATRARARRQHRRQGRNGQPKSRRHRDAAMAGDDDGVQGRQPVRWQRT